MSLCYSVYLSVSLYVSLLVSLSICLFVCLSVCLFVRPSVCRFAYICAFLPRLPIAVAAFAFANESCVFIKARERHSQIH